MKSELVFTFWMQKVSLVFQMQKLASLKTTFVIVDMLLFSWWCEDDFTQCFHWALSTKKIWSRVINLFIDTSSMHSRTFCKKSTKFINWLLDSCFNEDNLVYYSKFIHLKYYTNWKGPAQNRHLELQFIFTQ